MSIITQEKNPFTIYDCFVIFLISFLSLHVRLWKLGYPNEIVFDEVYFGNFSNAYITESFYSDIHPPFGKLIMAGVAWLTQYPGNIDWGKALGKFYEDNETNYVSLRITPSVFSSFCPVLIYCSMKNLAFSIPSAITASFLVLFDFTQIVEAKFILSDGMLHFFTCLHIFAFTLFLRDHSFIRTLFAGITMGIAFSCKLTAMGLIAMDGITQLLWIIKYSPSLDRIIARAATLLVPCFSIFIISWIVHFDILKYHDTTGAYSEAIFAPYLYSKEKINYTYKGDRLINRNIFAQILKDSINTHKANMRITNPHPWSSMPINWPLLLDKYVFFYGHGPQSIKCHGSPMTYWSTSLFIALTPILAIFGKTDWRLVVTFFGWAFSYLPFIAVPRAMYLYHYIVPMFFASMNLAALLETSLGEKRKVIFSFDFIICVLSVLCWIYFSPWIYGTYCEDCDERLMWVKRWNNGPPIPLQFFGEGSIDTKLITGSIPI